MLINSHSRPISYIQILSSSTPNKQLTITINYQELYLPTNIYKSTLQGYRTQHVLQKRSVFTQEMARPFLYQSTETANRLRLWCRLPHDFY